jgi:ABC-type transport system involved in multi-copper enzyme maturation permease subunit
MSAPTDRWRLAALVARRELVLLRRSRAGRAATLLMLAVAWLPPVLVALRAGRLDLASFAELTPLALAISGVLLPLLALVAGSAIFADEIEDRSLVPVLCLPVPRKAFFVGKLLGLGLGSLGIAVIAFGSVGAAVWSVRGAAGARDYLVVVLSGLLLAGTCLLIGAALGVGGKGRVRAYGAALLAWLILVFAIDALLLAIVLATAPPPPETVGLHGHAELSLSTNGGTPDLIGVAWMAVDPVSLFRWTSLTFSPELGARWRFAPGSSPRSLTAILGLGWLLWMSVPAVIAWRRFRRLSLG